MANILDYIHWRGDLTFEERSFNEVDNLIFSEFAYLRLDRILTNLWTDQPERQRLLEDKTLFESVNRTGVKDRSTGEDNLENQAQEGSQAQAGETAPEAEEGKMDRSAWTVQDAPSNQTTLLDQDTPSDQDTPVSKTALKPGVDDPDYGAGADIRAGADILTIRDIVSRYEELGYRQSELPNDPRDAGLAMAEAARYKDLLVSDYINIVDEAREIQFAAVTIHAPEFLYIAFRGTDNSIVGWREDFNFSYQRETPAQGEAVTYMNYILKKYRAGVYLADRYRDRDSEKHPERLSPVWMPEVYAGGHSKGGNLAIYAAAFCDPALQPLVTGVYSFDGPGFNHYITQTEAYQAILPKVDLTIPESSLIGILMSNTDAKKIVKCSAEGSNQHNPYTWLIERDHFEEARARSGSSVFLDGTINKWLDRLDDESKERFVRIVFDVIDAAGAGTFAGLMDRKWESYNAILNAVRSMPADDQKLVLKVIKELAIVSGDALWNEARKSFEENHRKNREILN